MTFSLSLISILDFITLFKRHMIYNERRGAQQVGITLTSDFKRLYKIRTVKVLMQIHTELFLDLDSACKKMLKETNPGESSALTSV